MSFLAPIFFAAGLLSLPVIALYILKIRRRGQVVSHLPLWDKLLVETQARSLFQKLRRLYSLLLQLLILASLVFALARPSGLFGNAQGTSTVLVLDVSSSMNTLEDASTLETRYDLMLER
ncbi:MAG: BatA domain-containing protein, partial [Planctomycetota bacterium]|nr:BatA domain-containing protein [Planctomycetota bacterium]